MEIPITQSKAWQKLQDDLNESNFYESQSDYQYLAILKKTPVGNYLYLPYGPVYENPSGFKKALTSLKKLTSKHNALFIRVEPRDPKFETYAPQNTTKTKDLNPKETWLLDLNCSDDELKAKIPKRLLRYYKNAEKNGISIETSNNPDDIHYLLGLQKALATKKGINTFSENYLKTELSQPFATLYLLRYQDESKSTNDVIAAGLVFDDDHTRYNLQGAQSEQGRPLHATGILTVQLILDAKAKKLKSFDFWGIAPENAPSSHPWAGFTAFKKTFDGYEQDYAGTYDIIINPLKYKMYRLFRSINRLLRRA